VQLPEGEVAGENTQNYQKELEDDDERYSILWIS
jgi:hypothetical protein